MHKKITLDNGLRIIAKVMPSREAVSLGIWIAVGGRFEEKDVSGISHYLEHMLFKGSKKYSCREIKETIEGKGGSLNGFTAEEYTCYLVKVLEKNVYESLEILSDMVLNPTLDSIEIDKERTVIMEEIKMYKDLPQYHVLEILDLLLWPNHPLGQNLTGSIESVTNIDKNKLYSFQRKFYQPENIVISLCGAFNLKKITQQIKKTFNSKDRLKPESPLAVTDSLSRPQVNCLSKPTEQSHLAIGFRSYNRSHPERFCVDLLHVILGANMSSRLFQEVREKRGLAYSIGTNIKRFKDSGAFLIHAGVDNFKVESAVDVIVAELENIKQKMNDSELKRAKDFYLGQLIMALEDVSDNMLFMGESIISLDKVYTLAQIKNIVKKITCGDIKRVGRDILDIGKINLALISPEGGKQVEILKNKFK
ncbi:MAG: pitrilysin family protein [Candidatus Omnitrophota bacterium]